MWDDMKCKLLEILMPYKDIIVGGDGRNDSPGFSARFCLYVAMDLLTNLIIDMEVLDKRETGGDATNMEREGLTRILLRWMKQIDIGEIATDASSSLMRRISDLKAIHPQLKNMAHSLDVWHMSKRLTKKLHSLVDNKEGKELKPWIEGKINHFWHCCENAKGDEEKLKDSWLGILHHICDEHEWADSQCNHGPLQSAEPKQYLKKDSAVMEKLRSVVLDAKILNKLKYYTKFRHTGSIENFNSMLTKYAPKRCAFDYPYFKCRMALAGIDHNMHNSRPQATTKDGQACFKRKYSKATRKFRVEPVKEQKEYSYVPYCLAKIVVDRQNHTGTVHERLARVPGDPKLISRNLDLVVKPPPTSNLIQERKSRMETKK
ncbi:uncharacterized protein LOC135683598 [Rhopilema esculentum]|uniref:uncharacterized protein LOC135683598 n=1 Tax=Rhopilema esculentum TaxID=499914 RepID=UPI0031E386D1